MPMLSLSSCELHYVDIPAKNSSNKTLVLLHANPGSHKDYDAVTHELAKTRRIIAIDWPGYANQSYFTQSLEQLGRVTPIIFYDLLVEAWKALGLETADIIGNSVGGNVAARFAANHPKKVNSLVLVSPGGFTKHNPFTKTFCKVQGSKASMPAGWFATMYLRRKTKVTRAMLQRAKTAQSLPKPTAFSRAMWRSFKTQENDLLTLAKDIKTPTTLIFGWFDPITPAITDGNAAQTCIPHAEKHILACGHCAFAEVPNLFLNKVSHHYR